MIFWAVSSGSDTTTGGNVLSFCFVDITLISNHLLSLHAGAPAAALKNIPTVPISALADTILCKSTFPLVPTTFMINYSQLPARRFDHCLGFYETNT